MSTDLFDSSMGLMMDDTLDYPSILQPSGLFDPGFSFDAPLSSPPSSEADPSFLQTSSPNSSPVHETMLPMPTLISPSLPVKQEGVSLDYPVSFNGINIPPLTAQSVPLKRKQEKTTLELSRDDLLKLSSKSLDDYARELASTRSLTPAEERQLKKQRRLIKNRESAQLSRQRKKRYIEGLERQTTEFAAEASNLKVLVADLRKENSKLKTQVQHLSQLLAEKEQSVAGKPRTDPGMTSKTVKVAGISLLLVLFSFGLLMNTTYNSSPFPFGQKSLTPAVLPASFGRSLKSIELPAIEEPAPIELSVANRAVDFSTESGTLSDKTLHELDTSNLEPSKRVRILEPETELLVAEPAVRTPDAGLVETKSMVALGSTNVHSALRPEEDTWEDRWHHMDSNYIYCPSGEQILPADSSTSNPGNPTIVGLIVPGQSVNLTGTNLESLEQAPFLEITCSVVDIYPVYPIAG